MKTKSLMFKISLLIAVFMLLPSLNAFAASQPPAGAGEAMVTEANFPDAAFRGWVNTNCAGGDWVLSSAELAAVKQVRVPKMGIKTLKGIELFPGLAFLDCSLNPITTLDLTGCARLEELVCRGREVIATENAPKRHCQTAV